MSLSLLPMLLPLLGTAAPQAAQTVLDAPAKSSGVGVTTWLLPLLVLAALGGTVVWAKRRAPMQGRLLTILESTSLGPRRSLVVARLGTETLLLGSSEAGITLLAARTGLDGVLPLQVSSFNDLLEETQEDQMLRAKLALGRSGTVR